MLERSAALRARNSSAWHPAFGATGHFVLGALLPTAILVAFNLHAEGPDWPMTLLGGFFWLVSLTQWSLVFVLVPTSYFLIPMLAFGGKRELPSRRALRLTGAICGILALAISFVLEGTTLLSVACGLAALAAGAMILRRGPRPSRQRKRSKMLDSLATRRSSEPFAFGLAAATGVALAAMFQAILNAVPEEQNLAGYQWLPGLPFMIAGLGILLGAVFALGGALAALLRRGATSAAPYGLVAGGVCVLLELLLRTEGEFMGVRLMILTLAAGALGTLAGPRDPSEAPRRAERQQRRA